MPTGLLPRTPPRAEIGVFGGSGFYAFLDDVREVADEADSAAAETAPFDAGYISP